MLLLYIGNTNISLLYKQEIHTVPTNFLVYNPQEFLQTFPIKTIIFASVVPIASSILIEEAKKQNISTKEISIEDIALPITINNPRELGIDRAINAYAAFKKFGSNAIIVDFGTALTFDILHNGAYQGGMIYPGLAMAMHNLHTKTAKLPDVKVHEFQTGIGKNTIEAILFGACIGYAGVLKETIAYIQTHYKTNFKIIFTGGSGKMFHHIIDSAIFEENLILEFLATL